MPVFIVLSGATVFSDDLPYLLGGDHLSDVVQEQGLNAPSRAGLGVRPLDLSVFLFCHDKVCTALGGRTKVLFWANITSAAFDNTPFQ